MPSPPMQADSSPPIPAPLLPLDEANRTLRENVHPPGWTNPRPREKYDVVVVGGGTAGLVTAAIAVALGARVALLERHLLGGDCLNVGCVPSKAVLRSARAWQAARRARDGLRGAGRRGRGRLRRGHGADATPARRHQRPRQRGALPGPRRGRLPGGGALHGARAGGGRGEHPPLPPRRGGDGGPSRRAPRSRGWRRRATSPTRRCSRSPRCRRAWWSSAPGRSAASSRRPSPASGAG